MINVNGRFLTQRMTGSQRYAYEVVRRLVQNRDAENVRVFVPSRGASHPRELGSVTCPAGILRGHPWEQLELSRLSNRSGGVLWSPVNVGPVGAECHVVTIHDVFSIRFPQWVGRGFHLWYSFLLPRLAAAAQHIITVSQYSKQAIVEALNVPEEKVSVVYPGVDESFSTADSEETLRVRQRYGLPKDFILTVGSLEPRKNLDRVVEAWLRLEEAEKPPLVIVGGLGSQRVFGDYDAAELLRRDNVKLLGYVPEEDLPGLYSSATVFVYASLLEGFGLPPLEAMACGATVVTSRTSAMRETSGSQAFTVEPTSIDSIAEGITQAYQSNRTAAEKSALAESVMTRFDWTNTVEGVMAILERYE